MIQKNNNQIINQFIQKNNNIQFIQKKNPLYVQFLHLQIHLIKMLEEQNDMIVTCQTNSNGQSD